MRPRLWARLLFAAIGAAGCLLLALGLELFYARAHTASWVSHDSTPILLFLPGVHNDTERRLREANARSGVVEITLTWDNLNDLDLHCIDPNGQHIYFGTTPRYYDGANPAAVQPDGMLDVDQNRGPTYTQHPVEHIYFERGRAPVGLYKVFVDEFALHGGSDPTQFHVTVNEFGRIHHYDGWTTHADHRADGLGTKVGEFTTNASPLFALGQSTGFWRALLVVAVWTAALAAVLTTALLAGLVLFYRRVYRQRLAAMDGAPLTILLSTVWGALMGGWTQACFALVPWDSIHLGQGLARLPVLAILGALLGLSLGRRIPHLRRRWATLGGLLAAPIGACLFLPAAQDGWSGWEPCARVITAALLGLAIGFMIELIVVKPEPPPEPEEFEDEALDSMTPLSLRAQRMGPTGKLRRAGREPAHR
ncbi:MAG TPA: hypothetical protein VKT77_03980 [Chthonomonadaceae bacterium]|nr:hypothetical protein [Chthonomonadaceae bacterium]